MALLASYGCSVTVQLDQWRLDFVELRLHWYTIAERLEHDAAVFGCSLQHLHFFRGDIGRRLEPKLALDLLESNGNVSINEQGATGVNFRTRVDFKIRDRNFQPIRRVGYWRQAVDD